MSLFFKSKCFQKQNCYQTTTLAFLFFIYFCKLSDAMVNKMVNKIFEVIVLVWKSWKTCFTGKNYYTEICVFSVAGDIMVRRESHSYWQSHLFILEKIKSLKFSLIQSHLAVNFSYTSFIVRPDECELYGRWYILLLVKLGDYNQAIQRKHYVLQKQVVANWRNMWT